MRARAAGKSMIVGAAVAVAIAATVALPHHAVAGAGLDWSVGRWLDEAMPLASAGAYGFLAWIEVGYHRRPALMIGLASLLLLPPLALLGLMLHRRPQPSVPDAASPAGPPPGRVARLEIDGARVVVLPPRRDLVQIGRESDNDICLDDDEVHRYHAVIERTSDSGYTITDISGPDGNGLLVNGLRCLNAPLVSGDTLAVGRATMRFETAA